ncbi:MAG: hypothetical protein AcusKO_24770 [Acuticoccus sp.]
MRRAAAAMRAGALLAALAGAAPGAAADPLPALRLDPAGTTLSGLSSGAFMAVQMHVAFSEAIAGAGVVAGGPYNCARGDVLTAVNRCMQTPFGPPDPDALLADARAFAEAGAIDPLSGLAGDRVYLFSGGEDRTVTRPVVDAARDFYRAAGVKAGDIAYRTDVAAGHGFLTPEGPVPCAQTRAPFLNDCGIDQAGEILQALYGAGIGPPGETDPDRLMTFDQSAFLPEPERHGMDAKGFVYVPARCERETCRLHIAFHGCQQTRDEIGDRFARTAGYNAWAEAAGLVILYPQAQVIPSPLFSPFAGNPRGCWDWFGYDDPDQALRTGRQMAAVAAMAGRLGAPLGPGGDAPGAGDAPAPYCARHPGFNSQHVMAGRATFCGFGIVCAGGTGELLGAPFVARTLYESPQGSFSTTPCG